MKRAIGAGARRLMLLAGVWLVVTLAAVLAPGCYGRNCEPDFQSFGTLPNEGRMVDENTWESNPIDGKWLAYPHQRTYSFDLRELGGRTPSVIIPYISPAEEPVKVGQSTSLGGGNLTEIYSPRPNGLDVRNGTCADYFLRLVVIVPPLPPVAPSDGGADDSGGDASTDAGTDALTDASTDAPND